MNILSKASSLETTLSNMTKSLNGICVVECSTVKHPLNNCFSLNMNFAKAPSHIYSNGKGSCENSCSASAYGELIERLQTNNSFSYFYLPNRKHYPDELVFELGGAYLNDELKAIYNPSGEIEDEDLIDFNSDSDEGVVALPFTNLQTNEKIYFPINILANLYVSNGLASGNTAQEAQIQALSEIIERHVKFEVIKNGYSLPLFDNSTLSKYPKLTSDMELLRQKGHIVNAHDCSLGGVYPVTAISLINPANGTLFVSFGSHPILEVSLERTMTELMQGRDIDGNNGLDSFEVPTFDMELVSSSMNMESHFVDSNGKMGMGFLSSKKSFELSPWAYDGSGMGDELEFLTSLIYSHEKSIYIREYNHLGFYSTQIIVPEFSEVYAIDELIDNNKNRGKAVRDAVLNFSDYDPADVLDAVEELNDAIDVGSYIGVIFARSFSMLEFKIQLYILNGDGTNALNALGYMSERTPLQNAIFELLILQVLNKDINEYKDGLMALFTSEIFNEASDILECSKSLIDLAFDKQYEDILAMYDRVYEKHS